ncbi:quercetin dioxygenase-like cupin family protein [Saonia flava]|uniref:Quercetin dioxygenase-like cupin family protein n=1 Tax=Saonia flava TaxID=523696 RepID=A0A846QQR2_9FLAO|nr:cupin domain-containing protein [Saonia flava]NJB71366.1 quercetin dioxygenase-like cupin family protein [Saonia flava]
MRKRFSLFLSSILGIGVKAQYSDNLKTEELFASDINGIGQKIKYPNFTDAKVTIRKITFPPGCSTGWHKHNIPVFSYIFEGVLTIEFEDLETVQYSTGETFAESVNVYHRGINQSEEDVVVLVIYLGGDGQPLSLGK